MRITVLLFASLREAAGTGEAAIFLTDGSHLRDVWPCLLEQFPALEGRDAALAWAVNHAYAKPDAMLSDGDTVAALPPISGGALEPEDPARG